MSELVKDNADFINLLLNTTSIQAQALLDTITRQQVRVISQIARNLLVIPLGAEIKEVITENRKLIEKLANRECTIGKKCKIIGTHRKKIIHILRQCRTILQALIGRFSSPQAEIGKEEQKKSDVSQESGTGSI